MADCSPIRYAQYIASHTIPGISSPLRHLHALHSRVAGTDKTKEKKSFCVEGLDSPFFTAWPPAAFWHMILDRYFTFVRNRIDGMIACCKSLGVVHLIAHGVLWTPAAAEGVAAFFEMGTAGLLDQAAQHFCVVRRVLLHDSDSCVGDYIAKHIANSFFSCRLLGPAVAYTWTVRLAPFLINWSLVAVGWVLTA